MRVGGFHTNLDGKIPITIGTVPFTGPSAPSGDVAININPPANGSGNAASQMGWSSNLYPTAPPTFEQSQFGAKSIQDKNDNEYTRFSNNNQGYSPMYPVYNVSGNPQ